MDFFADQEKARRRTGWLLLYFSLAVVFIVAFISLGLSAVLSLFPGYRLFDRETLTWIGAGVLAVIIAGSLKRRWELRHGGEGLAEMLGAREIDPATRDAGERRLRNVVEEMAIASGLPVPRLYVLDRERGINAFVAGYQPSQSVMVVTEGLIEHLDRNELQAVVGHEFSHILHGDMRLNMHLLSLLAGIMIIGQTGNHLIRASVNQALAYRPASREQDNRGLVVFPILLGSFLSFLGYTGVFVGYLLQAAISRQREFLADASAVQFTRDKKGIVNALEKIRTYPRGSWLVNAHSEEMRHLCFTPSLSAGMGEILATHPPLEKRIEAINPYFFLQKKLNGEDIAPGRRDLGHIVPEGAMGLAGGAGSYSGTGGEVFAETRPGSAKIAASVGNPTARHVDYAASLIHSIPREMYYASHIPAGARALIYALLLGGRPADRDIRLAILREREIPTLDQQVLKRRRQIKKLGESMHLSLVDLALPALKRMNRRETEDFLEVVELLIQADRKVTLFEFATQTVLNRHLRPQTDSGLHIRYKSFKPLRREIGLLLSLAVHAGNNPDEHTQTVYQRNMRRFTPDPPPLATPAQCGSKCLNAALSKLAGLAPGLKKDLLSACADCVLADGVVKTREMELLRIVAESLDCPMPPSISRAGTRD